MSGNQEIRVADFRPNVRYKSERSLGNFGSLKWSILGRGTGITSSEDGWPRVEIRIIPKNSPDYLQ